MGCECGGGGEVTVAECSSKRSQGLERVIPEGGRVAAGVFLPAGTLVRVSIISIQHDSSVYEVSSST